VKVFWEDQSANDSPVDQHSEEYRGTDAGLEPGQCDNFAVQVGFSTFPKAHNKGSQVKHQRRYV
jgi:hypothetical protein